METEAIKQAFSAVKKDIDCIRKELYEKDKLMEVMGRGLQKHRHELDFIYKQIQFNSSQRKEDLNIVNSQLKQNQIAIDNNTSRINELAKALKKIEDSIKVIDSNMIYLNKKLQEAQITQHKPEESQEAVEQNHKNTKQGLFERIVNWFVEDIS